MIITQEVRDASGKLRGWRGIARQVPPRDFGPHPVAAPAEIYVQPLGPEDDDRWHRTRFLAYWHDVGLPALGGPGTTRGQIFYTDMQAWINFALENHRVYLWPWCEQVTRPYPEREP